MPEVIFASDDYLQALRQRCSDLGASYCISTGGATDWPLGACLAFMRACEKITAPPTGWLADQPEEGWYCPKCGIQNGHEPGCPLDYSAAREG
jgi:hypothetical protein